MFVYFRFGCLDSFGFVRRLFVSVVCVVLYSYAFCCFLVIFDFAFGSFIWLCACLYFDYFVLMTCCDLWISVRFGLYLV